MTDNTWPGIHDRGDDGETLRQEAARALMDALIQTRSTVTAEPILRYEDSTLRDVFQRLEPVVASFLFRAAAEGEREAMLACAGELRALDSRLHAGPVTDLTELADKWTRGPS